MDAAKARALRFDMGISMLDKAVETHGTTDELSLFGGGLLYRWQVFCRLVSPTQWHLTRRLLWTLAVTWLPLVIITAFSQPEHLLGLLQDYGVFSRIVIVIPVLLMGQLLMEVRFRVIAVHLQQADLLDDEDQIKIDQVFRVLRRLRDAVLPELIIIAAVLAELLLSGQYKLVAEGAWAVTTDDGASRLSVAGWYYLLVSLAIYQFLMLFSFWKWLLWSYLLVRLSRMRLKLVATHLDRHGGLGFLGLAAAAFNPIALALSASIASTWRYQILHSDMTLASLRIPVIGLLVLIFLAELGPMCFFVPRLAILRSKALLDYGVLAQKHASYFHEKWVARAVDWETQRADISDVTTLAFAASYDRIKRMNPFPVDKGALIGLALAILAPLLPVVLAEIPLSVILRGLLEAVRAVPV
jgi:hypothetical protein